MNQKESAAVPDVKEEEWKVANQRTDCFDYKWASVEDGLGNVIVDTSEEVAKAFKDAHNASIQRVLGKKDTPSDNVKAQPDQGKKEAVYRATAVLQTALAEIFMHSSSALTCDLPATESMDIEGAFEQLRDIADEALKTVKTPSVVDGWESASAARVSSPNSAVPANAREPMEESGNEQLARELAEHLQVLYGYQVGLNDLIPAILDIIENWSFLSLIKEQPAEQDLEGKEGERVGLCYSVSEVLPSLDFKEKEAVTRNTAVLREALQRFIDMQNAWGQGRELLGNFELLKRDYEKLLSEADGQPESATGASLAEKIIDSIYEKWDIGNYDVMATKHPLFKDAPLSEVIAQITPLLAPSPLPDKGEQKENP